MCPICYKTFENADVLQEHFHKMHDDFDKTSNKSLNTDGQTDEAKSMSPRSPPSANTSMAIDGEELSIWKQQLQMSEEARFKCNKPPAYS